MPALENAFSYIFSMGALPFFRRQDRYLFFYRISNGPDTAAIDQYQFRSPVYRRKYRMTGLSLNPDPWFRGPLFSSPGIYDHARVTGSSQRNNAWYLH